MLRAVDPVACHDPAPAEPAACSRHRRAARRRAGGQGNGAVLGVLQWAVGQPGNEANMRRLARESGAGLVNPIGPATIVSRDIRQDRLRVFLDADNTITAVRCE